MFSRAWRGLDRPTRLAAMPPDELRLRRARNVLAEFGTLWRNPTVPDQLREDALREILGQIDVDGAEIVAIHPAPNENAWLLGLVAVREQRLTVQPQVGLVGARGVEPSCPTLAQWSGSCGNAAPLPVSGRRDVANHRRASGLALKVTSSSPPHRPEPPHPRGREVKRWSGVPARA